MVSLEKALLAFWKKLDNLPVSGIRLSQYTVVIIKHFVIMI